MPISLLANMTQGLTMATEGIHQSFSTGEELAYQAGSHVWWL